MKKADGSSTTAKNDEDPNEPDMGLVEYPLFPEGTSLMHYSLAARDQSDFHGYAERLRKYEKWAEKGFDATAADQARVPILINYAELVNIFCVQERQWNAQIAFSEMVLENADKHVMGYWAAAHPSVRTLDTLCSRSAYSRVLTREPHDGLEFNHHYDEVKNPQSRFYKCIADWKAVNRRAGLACLYLIEFTPQDVRVLHARFPHTRIVGITTPRKNGQDVKDIARILTATKTTTTTTSDDV